VRTFRFDGTCGVTTPVAMDRGLMVHMQSNPIVLKAKTDSKANEVRMMYSPHA